jgi:cytochrome c oxidase subunit 2
MMTISAPFSCLPLATVLRVLNPESSNAREIYHLGVVTAIILGTIFVLVAGGIVYALMRYRWREGEADPVQLAGNKMVEIIWTLIPCVIVIALFMLTARTMALSDPTPAPKPDLVVVGHQWWWEVRYPNSGVITANEIHIPVGKAFSVKLESSDVLHEFWVPELARKITAVPGHPNNLWIKADKAGTYQGMCTEFCGVEHAWMHFIIIAESQAKFDAWQKAQLLPAATPTTDSAAKGITLFQQSSCVSCHMIHGTAAVANIGPDLTHFAGRQQLGAGVAMNTRENLRSWLKDPQQVKPGVKMPNFKFTDTQLTELVDYIETLK